MAAAIPRADFPGFLPVGMHEVYDVRNTVTSDTDVIARIAEAATSVRATPSQIERVRECMCRRCETCIVANGRNFEHLL